MTRDHTVKLRVRLSDGTTIPWDYSSYASVNDALGHWPLAEIQKLNADVVARVLYDTAQKQETEIDESKVAAQAGS